MSDPLTIYFQERIIKAVDNQNKRLSDGALFYLMDLMVRSSRVGEAFLSENVYLADLYQKSLETDSRKETFETLKFLGDHSLVVVGCFSESVERKTVGLEYYIGMGSSAYFMTSHYCSNPSLFEELSYRYRDCASVLNETIEGDRTYSVRDISRLYDLWLSTKSESIKKKLDRLGMVLRDAEG